VDAGSTTLFGKYLLFERISSGGKAEIWRAVRQGGDRYVALKRLRPSLAKDAALQAMFIREAKIAVQLSHPNIPQVFDLGLINGDFYIELEYLPGANLRSILPRCEGPGVVPYDLAAFTAAELCDALDHVHRKAGPTGDPLQLVHRDVTPDNCVVTFDGRVKLIDFSAATGIAPQGASPYLSPEQLHGASVDRRSDVFSLSVILYEAITGRRLYSTVATPLAKELHCCRPVLPPRAINPKIPGDLERIVLTGLEHDRARRYQAAADMASALRDYLDRHAPQSTRSALQSFMESLFPREVAEEASRLADLARRLSQAPRPAASHESGGFDFEIDESLMQRVVPHPDLPPDELTMPRGSKAGASATHEDADGPAPTIVVPITLPPGTDPQRPTAPEMPAVGTPAASGGEAPKRRAERWRIAVPVRGVWGASGKLTNHFDANLVNLSTTGAKLRLDKDLPVPIGGTVGFTLPLRLHNLIALEGVVRWTRASPGGRELGVEFSQPHPELLKLHRVK